MKFYKSVVLIFCWIWYFSFNTLALEIKKIGVVNGLSNNNVVSFTQDREGLIWICTKDGLNRFDGNSFKIFKKSDTDTNSISSNVLNCVYADQQDDIVWIATEKNGIDAYNYRTHIFTHYRHDYSGKTNSLMADGVTHITGDNRGNLWLATYLAGIDCFDKKTKRFKHYNRSNIKDLVSDYNWYVMPYDDTTIYVGHVSDGFSIIHLNTKSAVNFRNDPNDPSSLPDNTVTCIYKDSKNHIWIGTRNGLSLFDPATQAMINFYHDPKNLNSLSHNFIKSFVEANDSILWIGTEGGGINILDLREISKSVNPKNIRFKNISASNAPDGLSSTSVQSILKDSYGNFWVGGFIGGINFIPKRESFFKKIYYLPYVGNKNSLSNKIVLDLCFDTEDNLWVANGTGGINIYRKGQKIKQISNISGQKELNVTSVYADRDSNIWIGTVDSKIFQYQNKLDQFEELNCFKNIKNLQIYNFFEDSRNNLWISTDIGLLQYNIKTGTNQVFNVTNSELTDNVIRAIAEDSKGNIWIGTLIGGLCVFDRNFNLLYNYGRDFDFYSVNYIYKDSKDRMWVCSQNDLFLFNGYDNQSVERYGKSSGLAESSVSAIVESETANQLWLSTINGISYFDFETKQFKNFNINDDISMGNYMGGAVVKTPEKTIYFGSQNGITYFDQILKQVNEEIPSPIITSFLVNNRNENLNELVDIPFYDHMSLKDYQNSFQVNFNIPDFSLSDKVESMFQMVGLDDNWYLINNDKQVTFRNLKPGEYIFRLKTRLHNKEWPANATSINIHISPPWWLTGLAKVIYVAFVILIVFFIFRFSRNRIRIKNELLFEKKTRQQEQHLNEEKIRFFTNITHELRTPMTLILGPLEDLLADHSLNTDQNKKITTIHRVANRLLQLINQILEFRKSENKNRQLIVGKGNIVRYIYDIGLKYKELNQNKDVSFQIKLPDERIEIFYDPEVITIIIDNLISNAFKYTSKGNIILEMSICFEKGVSYTEIKVSDTGYGISENDLPYIFDRYYQAKNTEYPVSGTGIGLALVKNMAELHEAEITVESVIGNGSQFTVRLLTDNSYPNAVHQTSVDELEEIETEDESKDLILVIDDNREIVDYIIDSLMDTYNVITAENGKVGFDLACEKVPDIVISDIMMPMMDGIELCREMKKDVRTCHIPVILLTAKGSMQDKSEGYNAGADSYLTKPFSGNLLKSRLKNILETRKKLSESYTTIFKDKQVFFNESTNQMDKEFLDSLTSIIEENIEDEEMNISTVANHMNMSHSTLYRKIKALTDMTANEYIRKVRMKIAEQLLLTNKYSISEVMYKIGINSTGYFRQCFKEEFGMNPSDYLQKFKAN